MDTRIENYDCPKNQEWIQNARKKNNDARILRVGWLYKRKRLEELRKNQTKIRGSLLMTVASEADAHQLIRNGLIVGPMLCDVRLWDLALCDGQCFRCWKWGHTQSVCNAGGGHLWVLCWQAFNEGLQNHRSKGRLMRRLQEEGPPCLDDRELP